MNRTFILQLKALVGSIFEALFGVYFKGCTDWAWKKCKQRLISTMKRKCRSQTDRCWFAWKCRCGFAHDAKASAMALKGPEKKNKKRHRKVRSKTDWWSGDSDQIAQSFVAYRSFLDKFLQRSDQMISLPYDRYLPLQKKTFAMKCVGKYPLCDQMCEKLFNWDCSLNIVGV